MEQSIQVTKATVPKDTCCLDTTSSESDAGDLEQGLHTCLLKQLPKPGETSSSEVLWAYKCVLLAPFLAVVELMFSD